MTSVLTAFSSLRASAIAAEKYCATSPIAIAAFSRVGSVSSLPCKITYSQCRNLSRSLCGRPMIRRKIVVGNVLANAVTKSQ